MVGRVTINVRGRDGSVTYSEGPGRAIEGYFEYGGADVVGIITMGSESDWSRNHGWAMERRDAILRFIGEELIRQQAPNSTAEIDPERGAILLRGGVGGLPKAAENRTKAAAFFWRLNRLKALAAVVVMAVAVAVGAVAFFGREALSVAQPLGSPLNDSLRYEGGIATLITRTDPHPPRWSGRGGKDTVTLGLLLLSFDGKARQVRVAQGLAPNNLTLARIFGSDGQTIWFGAAGIYGVRLRDGQLITLADLRRANPGMAPDWLDDLRGIDVNEGRLHVIARDRGIAFDVDPATLVATPATPRLSPPRLSPPSQDVFMAAGFVTHSGGWLGLQTTEDRQGAFRPGRWVRPVEGATAGNTQSFLTRAVLEPSLDRTRYQIRSIDAISATAFLNAGFLRLNESAEPVRLQNPRGALMVHTRAPALTGTLLVSRVTEEGQVLWTADTELDRFALRQILPGEDVSMFIGTRLPQPGRVSEPLAAFVDHDTGKVALHSLWRSIPSR